MIEAVANVIELEKIWRQTILRQTGLASDRVLNASSIRGVDLAKRFGFVNMSINIKDCFVVFQIEARQSDNDVSMSEEDDKLTVYKAYSIHLTVYGDSSTELSTMLKSRIETDKCRSDLFDKGVCFEEIESMTETNEFMNETVWKRVDVIFNFSIRLSVSQIDRYDDFEKLSDIETID